MTVDAAEDAPEVGEEADDSEELMIAGAGCVDDSLLELKLPFPMCVVCDKKFG